jgi:RNA polymerase sigma-70 factor (ECF subfamily)
MLNQDIIELAKKARKGDTAAFEELCERKSENILFNAFGILGNWQDAEDAAQETIIQMYRSLGQLKIPEAVEVWILQITRSKCYRILKKRRVGDVEIDADDEVFEVVDEDEFLPEKYAESDDQKRKLMEIVASLPPKRREVIFMYYYDDLSIKEIADITDTNVNTVTSNLSRARAMIRQKVTREYTNKEDGLRSGVSATILGGVLKETSKASFTPEKAALFNAKWQTAIHGMRTPVSPARHIIQTVVTIAITAAVFLGGVYAIMQYRGASPEVATVSIVTAVPNADVQGQIDFVGGDCECGHLNPRAASLGEPDIPAVLTTWNIADAETKEVLCEGEGTVVSSELRNLKTSARTGSYLLTFNIKDEDGGNYSVARIFDITS